MKAMSVVIIIAFFSMVCFPAYPEQSTTDQVAKTEKQDKAKQPEEKAIGQETKGRAEGFSEAEVNEYYSRDDANVIQDEGSPGAKVKKFPWLLAIGGAIVVGAVVYLLVSKKPKYDLVVTVGEGAAGNPAAGTYNYKKGTSVSYSYSLQTGYTDLAVKINGTAAPASGTITMDSDQTLSVTAVKVTAATLVVNSVPTGAQIILDGADSNQVTNYTFTFTAGGDHTITLRKLGYLEYTTTVTVNLGETQTVDKTLEEGLKEDFNSGAESTIFWQWQPRPSGNWSVSGGYYVADAKLKGWNYSIYNLAWASTKYTVEVRMNRSAGSIWSSNSIYLSTSSDGKESNGYLFNYTVDGWVSIWELKHTNFNNGNALAKPIKLWAPCGKLNTGHGAYNILKIVRNGAVYTFYINGKFVYSFDDDSFNPPYILIGGYCGNETVRLNFDYVYVSIDNTVGSVAGEKVKEITTTENPFFHKH